LVDGKVGVRNGRLMSVDEKSLVREVEPISPSRSKRLADETDSAVQRLYRRAFKADKPGRGFEK
jgi:hypothetical protein